MRNFRIVLVCFVVLLLAPVSAISQEDNATIAAARKLFGDYQVVPGERIGSIRLGETTQDEYFRFYGLTRHYGFRASPPDVWGWPERNFGQGLRPGSDQPFQFGFCQSNKKLFAAFVFNAGSWYPDHAAFWLFMERLKTPEGILGTARVSQWLESYGEAVAVLKDLHPPWTFQLFRTGLAIAEVPGQNFRPTFIGVYHIGICTGEALKGVYVAHFGRLDPGRLLFSKTGSAWVEKVAEGFKESELVYVRFEFTFKPPTRPILVTIRIKLIPSQGEVIEDVLHHTLAAPGQVPNVVYYRLDNRPRTAYGEWRVEISVNGTLLGQGSFLNTR